MKDASTFLNTGGLRYIVNGNPSDIDWDSSKYLNDNGLEIVGDAWKNPETPIDWDSYDVSVNRKIFLDTIGLTYLEKAYIEKRKKEESEQEEESHEIEDRDKFRLNFDISTGRVYISSRDGTDVKENKALYIEDNRCGGITNGGKFLLNVHDKSGITGGEITEKKVYITTE